MIVPQFNSLNPLNLLEFTLSFVPFKIKYNNLSTDPSSGNASIKGVVYNKAFLGNYSFYSPMHMGQQFI